MKKDIRIINFESTYVIDSYTKTLEKKNSKPYIKTNLYIIYPLLMDYIISILNIILDKYPDFIAEYGENINKEKFKVCINFLEYIFYRYETESRESTLPFKEVFPDNIYSKCLSKNCPDLITFWNIFTNDKDIIGISLAATVSREILEESFKDNFIEDSLSPLETPLLTFILKRSKNVDDIMSSFIQENKKFIKDI